jgi:hypothetical protein
MAQISAVASGSPCAAGLLEISVAKTAPIGLW